MKALRKIQFGAGNVEIVEVPEPTPQKGEVLMEVKRAGICGTDIHILHDLYPKVRPPVTLGHEFCGVVAQVGQGAKKWKEGDRVVVDSAASFCGTCQFCEKGQTQLCERRTGYGSSADGGFARFAAIRQEALHRLPDHASFQEGALVEPLACATHAVMEMSSARSGKTVLVTGPGTIGLLVLQVVKAVGARVIITGTLKDEERLKLARELGADHGVQIHQSDLHSLVAQLTDGYGVDLAFECSGTAGGVSDCISAVRKRGEIVQVGLFGEPVLSDYDNIVLKEILVKGSFAHNRETWVKAVDLLKERKVSLQPLVSGEFPLDRWAEGFKLAEEGTGLKYLLYPVG